MIFPAAFLLGMLYLPMEVAARQFGRGIRIRPSSGPERSRISRKGLGFSMVKEGNTYRFDSPVFHKGDKGRNRIQTRWTEWWQGCGPCSSISITR
jgi:hypothetical protein